LYLICRTEFLNRRWHEYTGLSVEDGHGWGWQVAIHPDDLGRLLATWESLLKSGEPGEIDAVASLRRGLSVVPIQGPAVPQRNRPSRQVVRDRGRY